MIEIVDYKVGNLRSVKKALDHLGYASEITSDPVAVSRADKIVLPGVGHFAATRTLDELGLGDAVREVVRRGAPFLGICVGMQWMFESSEEAPEVAGLGLFPGRCERFPAGVKSPHVGWNGITPRSHSRLLRDVAADAFVYYTHSYRAPLTDDTAAETEYGGAFAAAVERGNVFGVQFHPEKSGDVGLQIILNFCTL